MGENSKGAILGAEWETKSYYNECLKQSWGVFFCLFFFDATKATSLEIRVKYSQYGLIAGQSRRKLKWSGVRISF